MNGFEIPLATIWSIARMLLEILIIAFVIYKTLYYLRSARGSYVLAGIIILLGVMSLLSRQLHLEVITFLLNWILTWLPIGLFIIFQPEIRRFLERMGSSSLGQVFAASRTSPMDLESAIDQTVEAYTDMSRDKVGALMVFERQNLLDDVIKTGTALDCAVSSELLKNIFFVKAPMHDGAVIIRQGRILGAGCMLPLSKNVNLSRDLGMRHRAGIGMSENSDAVVVIVSEETGSISVAIGGMLRRHLMPETLENILRNELMPQPEEEPDKPRLSLRELLHAHRKGEQNGNQD